MIKENKTMKKNNKFLSFLKSNLLWVFVIIQIITLLCVLFEINIHNIGDYAERTFWITALYVAKKMGT
tara:strand:+ start:181 stop:384 length:204 start_codon:yes stop_codon:yes gene_type:complete